MRGVGESKGACAACPLTTQPPAPCCCRQAGSGPQFVAPGARPWAARGGGHPLAAFGGGGAAAAAPAALSLPYEAAGAYRSAPLGRPAGMSMPRFTLGQAAAPSFSAKNHQARGCCARDGAGAPATGRKHHPTAIPH